MVFSLQMKALYESDLNIREWYDEKIKIMSAKNTRSGKKYTGNHTTVTEAVANICDFLSKSTEVTKISPGIIKAGLRPTGGETRVKVFQRKGSLLLCVRSGGNYQEVSVYNTDMHQTIQSLVKKFEANKNFFITLVNDRK
jgi:hypothetical protein